MSQPANPGRVLATIMFTDAVAFSARMGEHESRTIALIQRDLKYITATCDAHHGRVLKNTGDGLLMYFGSAGDALATALQIQEAFAKARERDGPEKTLQHRVGIHLGDVLLDEADVMGDGVNIAARLLGEAEPGGICFSQTVYDVVKHRLALKATYLGPRELKNIREAVPVYQIIAGDLARRRLAPDDSAGSRQSTSDSLLRAVMGRGAAGKALWGAVVVCAVVLLAVFLRGSRPSLRVVGAPATGPAAQMTGNPRATQTTNSKLPATVPSDGANRPTLAVELGNGASMKLVLIQPGEFVMGSPVDESGRDNGERQHPVRITRAFYMGVTEVTQRQWKAVMGGNPSRFIGDDLPVEQISANTAVEFCQRLSAKTGKPFRLPTEAEWEYACRAGSTGSYAGTGRLEEMGWFQGNADGRTHPVAQKKPNDWGLFDMHGNVYEFCLDWYGEYPAGPATDPTGPAKSPGAWRVLRGGAWTTLPQICRSAYRGKTPPDYRYSSYGLRCVMESP